MVSREVLLAEHDCLRRSDIMAMKEMRGGEYLAAIRKRVMSHKPLVDDLVRLLLSALVWLLKLCTASRSIHTYVCAAFFFFYCARFLGVSVKHATSVRYRTRYTFIKIHFFQRVKPQSTCI
jgi:hypothetical protein